jgi:hypothetical protein
MVRKRESDMSHKRPVTEEEEAYIHQCQRAGMLRGDIVDNILLSRLTGKSLQEVHSTRMDLEYGVRSHNFGAHMSRQLHELPGLLRDENDKYKPPRISPPDESDIHRLNSSGSVGDTGETDTR